MANILDILTRAQALRQETALNSITPDRAGGIMYDTLILINQMQLEGGSLLISKVYSSVAAMEADTTPTSDLTGRALRPGQMAVIVPSSSSSSDMGSVYRYNEPGSWTLCGKIGGLPMDTVPTEGSSNGITSGAVYQTKQALEGEVSQLQQKVDELEDDIKVAETIVITPTLISGLRVGSSSINTNASEALYYIPVTAGKYYDIRFAFNDGYVRFGYTSAIPQSGMAVTGYASGNSSTTSLSRTMAYSGYFCFSFVASAITTEPTASLTNSGIGANVARLETSVSEVSQKLCKLKWMGTSGSLDTGEYGYKTDTKKIRYNTGNGIVDVPFYPGAVYTFENELYVYNGDTLVLAQRPISRFSNSQLFETPILELIISGYDATWVNAITAFRFAAVAEGSTEYIRLYAGSTAYAFRRVNDGKSGVLYFRRDSNDYAEQGTGIYVLMNRAKFSTISANTPITLDAGMVLNLDAMPTIREYISGLTDGEVSFITPTLVANYKGIGLRGWIVDVANNSYYYTEPIQVSRGDIVLLEVTCTSSLVAIAKTDASGTKYIPIAIGKGSSDTKYRYVADEDGYLAFTIYTGSTYSIRKVSSSVYDAIKGATADAIFRSCAELYLAGDLSKAPTYADLMARYDALITAYPNMMTKTKIGESGNGQDIFEIKITKGAYNNAGRRGGTGRDAEIAKPKFMIASGTHGYEPGSPNALCLFVSELVKGHPALSAIRNNVELRIIPCVNPDGYDAGTRTNANGVDINRNYDYNWTLHDEDTQNYSGPSAASEPETQAVQSWIDANTDAVFCLDWHQSSFNEEISCLGGTSLVEATGQAEFKRMYLVAINGIAGMLISRRGVADNSIFAYAYNENGSVHGIFNGYLANKGVPGGCLEVPASVADSGDDSTLTISVAADVIGNLCKKAEEKYHI